MADLKVIHRWYDNQNEHYYYEKGIDLRKCYLCGNDYNADETEVEVCNNCYDFWHEENKTINEEI